MYFITFLNLYNSQPHDHNCDRAREVCFFGEPAAPPPEEPETEPEPTPQPGDPCEGQPIPVAHTGSQVNANLYCSQFSCADTVLMELPQMCIPTGTIYNPYESCTCVDLQR